MSNLVLDTIHRRRSCRAYTAQCISPDILKSIIDAGVWAPSGGNSQSWRFTVVTNPEILENIRVLVRDGFRAMEISADAYRSLRSAKKQSEKDEYSCFFNAPALVIATNDKEYGNAMADCACALQNMMLAATSLDIGSCWVNQLHWQDDNPMLRGYLEQLGIPQEHTICGCIALGHIAKIGVPPKRKSDTIQYIQ